MTGNEAEVEEIARIIARRLGHNDDTGMHWERYVLPAQAIVEHYEKKRSAKGRIEQFERNELGGKTLNEFLSGK
ncbi:hypothetical protein [Microvirga lotononidis]|uniref:Uncharacterized protein n=1 Tax=Microvirga lotononidis TaxID=864069 RepID=I4YP05_9HYPH|nr:hypothetical protein [Microvirga lotononidis]EIM25697.1 hypothetical protein MicloDRAFT_00064240 [Microvirga lotononidis]WQO25633.1 hypothetical protein U0023_12995 [Microvirga lotononidis]